MTRLDSTCNPTNLHVSRPDSRRSRHFVMTALCPNLLPCQTNLLKMAGKIPGETNFVRGRKVFHVELPPWPTPIAKPIEILPCYWEHEWLLFCTVCFPLETSLPRAFMLVLLVCITSTDDINIIDCHELACSVVTWIKFFVWYFLYFF
jgi:hypothetical protein